MKHTKLLTLISIISICLLVIPSSVEGRKKIVRQDDEDNLPADHRAGNGGAKVPNSPKRQNKGAPPPGMTGARGQKNKGNVKQPGPRGNGAPVPGVRSVARPNKPKEEPEKRPRNQGQRNVNPRKAPKNPNQGNGQRNKYPWLQNPAPRRAAKKPAGGSRPRPAQPRKPQGVPNNNGNGPKLRSRKPGVQKGQPPKKPRQNKRPGGMKTLPSPQESRRVRKLVRPSNSNGRPNPGGKPRSVARPTEQQKQHQQQQQQKSQEALRRINLARVFYQNKVRFCKSLLFPDCKKMDGESLEICKKHEAERINEDGSLNMEKIKQHMESKEDVPESLKEVVVAKLGECVAEANKKEESRESQGTGDKEAKASSKAEVFNACMIRFCEKGN